MKKGMISTPKITCSGSVITTFLPQLVQAHHYLLCPLPIVMKALTVPLVALPKPVAAKQKTRKPAVNAKANCITDLEVLEDLKWQKEEKKDKEKEKERRRLEKEKRRRKRESGRNKSGAGGKKKGRDTK